MSELIKRLKREIKHTKEAFAAAWKIRQPIRRSAISHKQKNQGFQKKIEFHQP